MNLWRATPPTKSYFGAIVGRYGNRIAHATFSLDGKRYQLPANDGVNSLHGGIKGFDKLLWQGKEIPHGVELTVVSKDGDQGFPGTLTARVRYTLEPHALKIEYFATTDKDTVLNLTNHSYFNLAGEGQGDILNHLVTIPADRYTPVDSGLIPTGELAPVAGTPLDFRHPTAIGARINDDNEQLRLGGGYDHNYVLNGKTGVHAAGRAGGRTDHRAGVNCGNDPTWSAVLFRQFSRWNAPWETRSRLWQARWILPGNPAFSRLAQPPQVSHQRVKAGGNLS